LGVALLVEELALEVIELDLALVVLVAKDLDLVGLSLVGLEEKVGGHHHVLLKGVLAQELADDEVLVEPVLLQDQLVELLL